MVRIEGRRVKVFLSVQREFSSSIDRDLTTPGSKAHGRRDNQLFGTAIESEATRMSLRSRYCKTGWKPVIRLVEEP
jgi:hypothetical protein